MDSRNNIKNWTSLQNTMGPAKKRAMKSLINEYISLLDDPAEGFVVKVDNPFVWNVGIYGPPSTPYWGGYFKAQLKFPDEYPFEPPKIKFKSRFFHPNVYETGTVCMSILHNPLTEEVPSDLSIEEKWNPTLSVRTVLLSLISIMGSPNIDSPANLEATKMFRLWKEKGDESYNKYIATIVKKSKKAAEEDGVQIPTTLDEYIRQSAKSKSATSLDYNFDSDECSNCSSDVSFSNSDADNDDSRLTTCVTSSMTSANPNEVTELPQLDSINNVSPELSQPNSLSLPDQTHEESIQSSSTPNFTQSPNSMNLSPISLFRKRRPPPLRLFPKSDIKRRRKQ